MPKILRGPLLNNFWLIGIFLNTLTQSFLKHPLSISLIFNDLWAFFNTQYLCFNTSIKKN